MSRGSLKAWNTILGVKCRVLDRLERTLCAQRAELGQCREEVAAKEAQVRLCQNDGLQHAQRLDALLQRAQGISSQLYLDYDAYRQVLQEKCDAAIADNQSAERQLLAKQGDIRETNRRIGKANTQRDLIKKKIKGLEDERVQAEQSDQDEESAETSLARHMRAARESALQERAI
jgi:chromosome segregation ATPase